MNYAKAYTEGLQKGKRIALPSWDGKQWLQMFSMISFVALDIDPEEAENFDPHDPKQVSGLNYDSLLDNDGILPGDLPILKTIGSYDVNEDFYPLENFVVIKTEEDTIKPYSPSPSELKFNGWIIL